MASTAAISLLQFKERLKYNLSGNQIAGLLDKFLFAALKPIFLYTDWAHICIGEITILLQKDHRRKISDLPVPSILDRLYCSLVIHDRELAWQYLRKSGIQRIVWVQVVSNFLELTSEYKTLSQVQKTTTTDNIRMATMEKFLHVDRKNLYSIIQHVEAAYDLYADFKQMIIEKYVRLAYNESQKAVNSTTLHVDANDIFKNFILGVNQAIEKYTPNKGTLTSWVKWWFLNALTNPKFDHTYGQSFKISSTHRRNLSKKLEDGEHVDITWSEALDTIAEIASNDNTEEKLIQESDSEFWSNVLRECPSTRVPVLLHNIHFAVK